MASAATAAEFVNVVAEEVSAGIGRALNYWLGQIELVAVDTRLTATERIRAIEQILRDRRSATEK